MRTLLTVVGPLLLATLGGCAINWGGEPGEPLPEKSGSVSDLGDAPPVAKPAPGGSGTALSLPLGPQASLGASAAGGAPDMRVTCGAVQTVLASDAANCGRCGHSCLGGACSVGVCQPFAVVSDVAALSSIAVSGADVVYQAAGGVFNAPREGVEELRIGSSVSRERAVALDAKGVFFADASAIVRTERDTNVSSKLFVTKHVARELTVLGRDVHWIGRDADDHDHVMFGDSAGGNEHAVVDVDGHIRGIAYHGDYAFFATQDGRIVRALRFPGCAGADCTRELAGGENGAASVAVDASQVYWTNGRDGSIKALARSTGNVRVLTYVAGTPSNLTAVDGGLYFTVVRASGVTELLFLPSFADRTRLVAAHPKAIDALHVGVDAFYWATPAMGSVWKLAK